MAVFIAIVKRDGEAGYTASFPDFPGCAVSASTLDHVIAKAREALSVQIERLLEANQRICSPTAADAIERGDAALLTAVEVPDDLRITHIDVAIPALSLVRIDSFARRHGLTHGALFVEAVDRWAMQETVPRDRRGAMSDSATLFDFANPLEVRVEPIATPINAPSPSAGHERAGEGTNVEGNIDDITAELVRLLEGSTESRAIEETADDRQNRAAAKPE
jgi:predicted RNase H-like HicB family nuclease